MNFAPRPRLSARSALPCNSEHESIFCTGNEERHLSLERAAKLLRFEE